MAHYEEWDYVKCADCGKKLLSSGLKRKSGEPRRCRPCFTKWRIANPQHTRLYKGPKRILNGYVLIRKIGHPNANKLGRVFEHRLIMSEIIGRPLLPNEVVHHINGITTDNRPENLVLCKTAGEHINKFHHKKKGPFRKCSVDDCNRANCAKGLCRVHYKRMRRKLQPGWGH